MSTISLLVTITNRRKLSEFIDFYHEYDIHTGTISLGRGTAGSQVLDALGLQDDEKGIFFSMVTEDTWKILEKHLRSRFRIDVPGSGIVFTIPLSSIAGKNTLNFFLEGQNYTKEAESEMKGTTHELIIAIANYGYTGKVMEAARSAGAGGGTVLHGKGVGMQRAEQFLGVSLVSEKEVIFIVTRTERKNAIMKAIMEKSGPETKAGAIAFSLPVSDTAGLRLLEDDSE